jgi:hypothetical protein
MPVFVLTHHGQERLTLSDTTFTFVTDGIEAALDQAGEAAALAASWRSAPPFAGHPGPSGSERLPGPSTIAG